MSLFCTRKENFKKLKFLNFNVQLQSITDWREYRNYLLCKEFQSKNPNHFEKELCLKVAIDYTFKQAEVQNSWNPQVTCITMDSLKNWYTNLINDISIMSNKAHMMSYAFGDTAIFSKKLKLVLQSSDFCFFIARKKQTRCIQGITFHGAIPAEIVFV